MSVLAGGVLLGKDGSGSSGVWTPVISELRANEEDVDSGTLETHASYRKIGRDYDIRLDWSYTPVAGKIVNVLNFVFTFPSPCMGYYGNSFVTFTTNGNIVGVLGGGNLVLQAGDSSPYVRGKVNMGIGPYPVEARSDKQIYGFATGILHA